MTKRRASTLKRAVVISLPLLAVGGFFGFGVHIGDQNREAVLTFERDYLGWEVPSASQDDGDKAGQAHKTAAKGSSDSKRVQQPQAPVGAAPPATVDQPVAADSTDADAAAPAPTDTVIANAQPPQAPAPQAVDSAALALPVTVRIKVLVDERIADKDADWMPAVMQTIAAASRVYQHHFTVELSLSAIVRWPQSLVGMNGTALLQSLRTHPLEGADVVLGFIDRRLDRSSYELSAPQPDAAENQAYALVGRSAGERQPHLAGVLRALGHLLGARTVDDRNSEAYRLGSFMRDGPLPREESPWIDLDNRQRILSRKARPFQQEPAR